MDGSEVRIKKSPVEYKDEVKAKMTEMTTQEVADKLGISRHAVTQMENKALAKARRLIKARINKQDILPD